MKLYDKLLNYKLIIIITITVATNDYLLLVIPVSMIKAVVSSIRLLIIAVIFTIIIIIGLAVLSPLSLIFIIIIILLSISLLINPESILFHSHE